MRVALQMSRAGCVSPCRRSSCVPRRFALPSLAAEGGSASRPIREPCTIWRKCKSPATRMTSNYPVIAALGWLALALGAALLGGGRERRLAAAGLLTLGLGLAAWRAELGRSRRPARVAGPPGGGVPGRERGAAGSRAGPGALGGSLGKLRRRSASRDARDRAGGDSRRAALRRAPARGGPASGR